jgi:crotonobetainyl-CoA:carnitine CoA-transferase CaiB-like acyl-CoA transferase
MSNNGFHGYRGEELPLSGITVVDLTQIVAGPFATMTFGDLGAEVIKVEAVGRGDRCRNIDPIPEYFDAVNRNKRSVGIDLKSEAGQRIVREMVSDADVFVESTKPGRIESYNLSYEELREVNPELVYCSITGFGTDSPYENLPAWDMLVQAMSGAMSMTGEEDGPPVWSGLPSGDLIASMYAVQSVLAALFARERGSIRTEWIEVPMLDAAISWLTVRAGYTFGTGEPFPRSGDHHPSLAPFGVFDCNGDRLVIAAGTPSLWRDFCSVIGREDLLADDRFSTMSDRGENVEVLTEIIEAELATDSSERWVERFQAADVPAGPIHDTETVWEDPHVRKRNLHRVMERPDRQDAEVIDHPVHFSALATQLATPPERLGESSAELLARYGYDGEDIERLVEEGVVE